MIIPVGHMDQEFRAIDKLENGTIKQRTLCRVNYVPLTEREAQLNGRHR
jgi:protein-L-isoaspartate O-methyltransferase